jgi:uncharacterized protein
VRVYLDSSSALKRVLDEPESAATAAALRTRVSAGDVLLSSSLAWVEVARAPRPPAAPGTTFDVDELADVALSGVLERPITPDVVALARRLAPPVLRSLDAIHLATALVLDVDVVLTHDPRLAEAARHHGVRTESPGA